MSSLPSGFLLQQRYLVNPSLLISSTVGICGSEWELRISGSSTYQVIIKLVTRTLESREIVRG